tara:strand:- start:509 stop:631 length:123 start_codon:yes stop_codon:yes gene_type:complete
MVALMKKYISTSLQLMENVIFGAIASDPEFKLSIYYCYNL